MAQRTGNILNPARRMVVRLGLATGATVSAVLGAQTLAMLDQRPAEKAPNSATLAQQNDTTSVLAVDTATSSTITDNLKQHAAPVIIVIRNPGAAANVKVASSTSVTNKATRSNIVPQAAKIVPPSPVVEQAPVSVGGGGGGGGGHSASQPAPASKPSGK